MELLLLELLELINSFIKAVTDEWLVKSLNEVERPENWNRFLLSAVYLSTDILNIVKG